MNPSAVFGISSFRIMGLGLPVRLAKISRRRIESAGYARQFVLRFRPVGSGPAWEGVSRVKPATGLVFESLRNFHSSLEKNKRVQQRESFVKRICVSGAGCGALLEGAGKPDRSPL